tara:strand:- start:3655 stop:3942 length:288 start_codon:yes stop_codon:yes gene_type:complete
MKAIIAALLISPVLLVASFSLGIWMVEISSGGGMSYLNILRGTSGLLITVMSVCLFIAWVCLAVSCASDLVDDEDDTNRPKPPTGGSSVQRKGTS